MTAKPWHYVCDNCGHELASAWKPEEINGTRLELCPKCRNKLSCLEYITERPALPEAFVLAGGQF